MISWLKKLFKKKSAPSVKKTEAPSTRKTEVKTAGEIIKAKEMSMVKGLENWDGLFADISHWESNFDAKKYDKPILINKCTDGRESFDKTHAKRKQACKVNGILYAGYHFYQCDTDIVAQAENYIKTHGEFILPPIIDYEKDKGQDEDDLKRELPKVLQLMKILKERTGKTPIFYTYRSMLKHLKCPEEFKQFPLWMAKYSLEMGEIPGPWEESDLFAWQYGDGKLKAPYQNEYAGIGECDGNIYNFKNDVLKLKK
jgi:lysozyme